MPVRVTAEAIELEQEVPLYPQLSNMTPAPEELLLAVILFNVIAPLVWIASPIELNLNWLLPLRVTAAIVEVVQEVPLYLQLSSKAPYLTFELFARLLAVMAPLV